MGSNSWRAPSTQWTEFNKPRQPPSLPEVFDAIENSKIPIVAAIHGSALGGGLELALACHARVAMAGAQVGLPEVKRGFVPGAGGTQRLPRLIGGEAALKIIVTGEPIRAEEAVKAAHSADVKTVLIRDGLEATGTTPAAYATIIKTEVAKWIKVVKAAGITAQ